MAKDMTLLWGDGSPPCWRVLITLEEKALQGYNSKLLSFEKGEHKSQQVLMINPRGQLPTFKHGERVVNESAGACMYLENEFKEQGTHLTPTCPKERAVMYQRIFEASTLGQKLGDVIYYDWKVPEGERQESAKKRNKEAAGVELSLWEGYICKGPGPFLAGKNFSLADVVVFPNIAYAFHYGLCPERFPKLAQYYNMLKDRPSINKHWPTSWTDTKDLLKDIAKTK
ncbi:glutathione S-transferase A-like [Vanacampus margaritifer]